MRIHLTVLTFLLCSTALAQNQSRYTEIQKLFDAYRTTEEGTRYRVVSDIEALKPSRSFLEAKLKHGMPHEKELAVELVAELSNPESVTALKAAFQIADPELASKILMVITSLNAQEGLRLARERVDDKRDSVRVASLSIIAKARQKQDWPTIVRAFSDKNSSVRRALISYATPLEGSLLSDRDLAIFILDSCRDPDRMTRLAVASRLAGEPIEDARKLLAYLVTAEDDRGTRDLLLQDLLTWYEKFYRREAEPAVPNKVLYDRVVFLAGSPNFPGFPDVSLAVEALLPYRGEAITAICDYAKEIDLPEMFLNAQLVNLSLAMAKLVATDRDIIRKLADSESENLRMLAARTARALQTADWKLLESMRDDKSERVREIVRELLESR